ncbi:MAG TPA: hypothetical protein VKW06_10360 [Candidatus Angelobacter sp.]|nr:hypothetical protein [Candidatus Angelobacter sp.]
MIRVFAITPLLLAMLASKGCELGPMVESQMKDGLAPYFPNAIVRTFPQQQAIAALSCLDGAGPSLVDMVGPALANNPKMSELRLIRVIPGFQYRNLGLGFEESLVIYNIESGNVSTIPMGQDYTVFYKRECGRSQDTQENGVVPAIARRKGSFIWLGHFTVIATFPDQTSRTVKTTDTLGLWHDQKTFDQHKDSEVEMRRKAITDEWTAQGATSVIVSLESVDKVSIHW